LENGRLMLSTKNHSVNLEAKLSMQLTLHALRNNSPPERKKALKLIGPTLVFSATITLNHYPRDS